MLTGTTIDTAIDVYLGGLYRIRRHTNAIKQYEYILDRFRRYLGGYPPLVNRITTEEIALFFNFLQGCQTIDKRLQDKNRIPEFEPAEFDEVVSDLYKFWNWVAHRYDISTPFIPKSIVKESKCIPHVSEEALGLLIGTIRTKKQCEIGHLGELDKYSLRNATLIRLLADTGIRGEELSKLTVKDVNLTDGTIIIYNVNNKERLLPCSNDLIILLEQYISRNFPKKPNFHKILISKDHLGTPIDRKSLNWYLNKLGSAVGIKDLHALKFRASFAHSCREKNFTADCILRYLDINKKQHLRLYFNEVDYQTIRDDEL